VQDHDLLADVQVNKLQKVTFPETLEDCIMETISELEDAGPLTFKQRLQLFRALITYLTSCLKTPMAEKQITCFSVHALAQAIVDLEEKEGDNIDIHLELAKDTLPRLTYSVPKFIVRGLKLYYLEARPHFMPAEGVSTWSRRFPGYTVGMDYTVETTSLFINSNGKDTFRSRPIGILFKEQFETLAKTPELYKLNRQVEAILPLSADPSAKIGKVKTVARAVHKAIDGYLYKVVRKAVRKRQDQQKYARQQARAEFYRNKTEKTIIVGDPLTHLVTFYSRQSPSWEPTDIKKVMDQVASLKKSSSRRRCNPLHDSTGLRHKDLSFKLPQEQEGLSVLYVFFLFFFV